CGCTGCGAIVHGRASRTLRLRWSRPIILIEPFNAIGSLETDRGAWRFLRRRWSYIRRTVFLIKPLDAVGALETDPRAVLRIGHQ
ncbi:MAG: hypothetical protein EBT04_02405, partial [Betaproteobacteria bacterium]|nr:hypothetical protein [Betaproteobacteria bacterium]